MSKTYFIMDDKPKDPSNGYLNKREAWMPKGDLSYYDKTAQRTFNSRREKRQWLAEHGMREAGSLVNPSKHIEGREKHRPSQKQRELQAQIAQDIQSNGGVNGLLDRLEQKRKRGVAF